MNLTNYTQIEQAREDVKALLADSLARDVKLGTGRIWHKPAGHASIKVQGFDVDTILTLNKRDAWNQVRLSQRDAELLDAMATRVSAYYRPDGDRYVVTDLGEGVRALRLRTGICMLTFPQVREVFERTPEMPGVHFGADSALYATEGDKASVTAAEVPDALCRVMLASLRVAQS